MVSKPIAIVVILFLILTVGLIVAGDLPVSGPFSTTGNFEPNPIVQDEHNREKSPLYPKDPLNYKPSVDFESKPKMIKPEKDKDSWRRARLRYDNIEDYHNLTPKNELDDDNPYIDRGTKFVDPNGSSFVQEYLRYDKDDEVRHLIDGPRIDKKYYTPSWISEEDMVKYPPNADFNGKVWEVDRSLWEQ